MSKISRRKLIAAGIGATAGASGLTLAAGRGWIPPNYGTLYGIGETLTYASHRFLTTNHSLAREFPRGAIAQKPFANGRPPKEDEFWSLEASGFADWRLQVDGLVANPGSLSLDDIRGYPAASQITQLTCEEGWCFIAEWIGTPLSRILELARILPEARYVVYSCIQPGRKNAIDMADAFHPQTLVTYGMNGGDLPIGHGGPLCLRVPRQLGYKNMKYLTHLTVTDRLDDSFGKTRYSWYAGI